MQGNKTAIVTGASGNMGRAIVQKFLDNGYRVIGTIIPGDNFSNENPLYENITVDLMDENGTASFVQAVIEKYESIDAIISTVGGFGLGFVTKTGISDIQKQIRLNFDTAYNVIRPVFSQMLKQGHGRIFMTGARPGFQSNHAKGMVAYSLSKSLLFRLSEHLNEEAKGTDIVTSVVVPSTIDTPQNRKSMPNANFNDWVTPEEIADIIFYHSSPEAMALRQDIIRVYGNS